MDIIGVQTNFEGDFSQRLPLNYVCYNAHRFVAGYWVGAITNTGGDVYTCANPSYSTAQGWTGAYQDNEIFQGTLSATNSGGFPTLNVNGRGAKPIFQFNCLQSQVHVSSAPSAGGQQLKFTFNAPTWTGPQLNGGASYAFTYTTSAGASGSMVLSGTNQITIDRKSTRLNSSHQIISY